MLESAVLARVRLALSRAGVTMFRNNSGLAWYGPNRDQPVRYGLCEGGSDLVGWTPVKITLDMVGNTVAVFSAVEVKRPKGGRVTKEQQHFINVVNAAGGLAGVAKSEEEAVAIIKGCAKG